MTQLVMSWMSDPQVSQQIKGHMTAGYKDYDQARDLLSQLLITQWKDYLAKSAEKSPAQRAFLTQLNQQTQKGKVDSLLSRSLAQSLTPHFKELVRLRK